MGLVTVPPSVPAYFLKDSTFPKEVWGRERSAMLHPQPQDWRGRLWDAVDLPCGEKVSASAEAEPGLGRSLQQADRADVPGLGQGRLTGWRELDMALPKCSAASHV